MHTLLLMRHAKSSWKDTSLADEDRPLNKRGKEAALRMGDWLREQGLQPNLILCSTAKRACQTAKRVMKGSGSKAKIIESRELYFTGPEAYLRQVADAPNAIKTLLLIGHNPDMTSLISRIAGEHIEMPTAAIARVEIKGDHWQAVLNGKALELKEVWRPKNLESRG